MTRSVRSELADAAGRLGDRVFLDGDTRLGFAIVLERVDAYARRLRPAAGRPVVITGANSVELVLWILAALASGVPVIPAPPSWNRGAVAGIASVAGAAAIIAGEEIAWEPVRSSRWPAGAALAFATSGSTGAPRLALRSEASLLHEGDRYRLLLRSDERDVFMAALPLAHAFTFGAALMGALCSRGRLVCGSADSARGVAARAATAGVTFLPMVAALARPLAVVDGGRAIPSRLRIAMVGAGPFPANLADEFEAKWGVPLGCNYGSSETGSTLGALRGNAGRPLDGVTCALAAGEPEGAQLWVKLATPPIGHLSAAGFEPVRLAPGGYYATGDLARRAADGTYAIVGRVGDMIRRGGHTIVPAEVARAIETHPAVTEALVRGIAEPWGDEAVEAVVALRAGVPATAPQLHAHLRALLPAYAIPTRWDLRDELPRTWSGKPAPSSVESGSGRSSWFDALLAYRWSEAIFAADELGVFERLREVASAETLAAELGVDATMLAMLLDVLADAGAVARCGSGFTSRLPLGAASSRVIALERRLRTSWLSAESIVAALRGGEHGRPFEREITPEFARCYRDAMNGGAHLRCARRILRAFPAASRRRVAEIGHAIGALSRMLKRRGDGPAELHPLDREPWEALALAPQAYGLVFVFNGIHWLRPESAPAVFGGLLDALEPGGALAIVDLFAPEPGEEGREKSVSPALQLDWLTHGGLHLLRRSALADALAAAGARDVRHERIAGSFDFVTCAGRSARTSSAARTVDARTSS